MGYSQIKIFIRKISCKVNNYDGNISDWIFVRAELDEIRTQGDLFKNPSILNLL